MPVSILLVAARGVHFASVMLLFGGLAFAQVVVAPTHRAPGDATVRERVFRWQVRLCIALLVLAVMSACAWLAAAAAGMSGASLADALQPETLRVVLLQTRFGVAWLARLGLAALAAVLLARWRRAPAPAATRAGWPALAAAGALAASLAFVGHAGAASGVAQPLRLANDAAHVLAASGWLGGLAGLCHLLRIAPRARATLRAVQRFSMLGLAVVATIVATGAINTRVVAGSVAALTGSTYGALLGCKLCLVCAMLLLACYNRAVLTPGLPETGAGAAAALRHSVMLELAAGIAVVAVVAALGVTAPG